MKIQDFNTPPEAEPAPAAVETAEGPALADERSSVELALLRAQVEHLELVVETARSLMTSNQERLLRRLHDVPREMAALTARLERLDHPSGASSGLERNRTSLRRVV
jgi:hypothetical protein